ncbi:hypothetical protein [Nostoc sp.]|uniref:hypothetical protein n=1 Tax=Nostoc sp. TaxID=1180 RepID=UPI002FF7CF56
MGIGNWRLGIGDWRLAIGKDLLQDSHSNHLVTLSPVSHHLPSFPIPQSPVPSPQSPVPSPHPQGVLTAPE